MPGRHRSESISLCEMVDDWVASHDAECGVLRRLLYRQSLNLGRRAQVGPAIS